MERALLQLVERESDFQAKKKHPARWYRDNVGDALELKDNQNASIRSYEVKLSDIRTRLRTNSPLDAPWNIGLCLGYYETNDKAISYFIDSKEIPLLIRIKAKLEELGEVMTIRWARWLSFLAPALAPAVQYWFPKDVDEQDKRYAIISREYAARERFYQAVGRTVNTSDLDILFFRHHDLSEDALWAAMDDGVSLAQLPRPANLEANRLGKLEASPDLQITREESEMLHGFLEAYKRGAVWGQIYLVEYQKKNHAVVAKLPEPNENTQRLIEEALAEKTNPKEGGAQ